MSIRFIGPDGIERHAPDTAWIKTGLADGYLEPSTLVFDTDTGRWQKAEVWVRDQTPTEPDPLPEPELHPDPTHAEGGVQADDRESDSARADRKSTFREFLVFVLLTSCVSAGIMAVSREGGGANVSRTLWLLASGTIWTWAVSFLPITLVLGWSDRTRPSILPIAAVISLALAVTSATQTSETDVARYYEGALSRLVDQSTGDRHVPRMVDSPEEDSSSEIAIAELTEDRTVYIDDELSDTNLYSNHEEGYQIQFPLGWKVFEAYEINGVRIPKKAVSLDPPPMSMISVHSSDLADDFGPEEWANVREYARREDLPESAAVRAMFDAAFFANTELLLAVAEADAVAVWSAQCKEYEILTLEAVPVDARPGAMVEVSCLARYVDSPVADPNLIDSRLRIFRLYSYFNSRLYWVQGAATETAFPLNELTLFQSAFSFTIPDKTR